MLKLITRTVVAALVILSTISIISCTGKMVLMKNNAGDVQRCEVSAQSEMLTGAWAAGREVDRCVEQWTKAGYKKVE